MGKKFDKELEFHKLFGFPYDKPIEQHPEPKRALESIGFAIKTLAVKGLPDALEMQARKDERLYRIHLIAEEFYEMIEAILQRDEVALADALGDLLYVVVGTAVTYGIPIDEVFDEIHRSNMTKERKKSDPRMKQKGENYSPPNIQGVLDVYRKG